MFHSTTSLLPPAQRLIKEIQRLRKEASFTRLSVKRQRLIQRAREAQAAIRTNGWINSPGLRPPT